MESNHWACTICGEPRNSDPDTCANCGGERVGQPELPPPRLKFLWLWWFGATTLAHFVGWSLVIMYFPWEFTWEGTDAEGRLASFFYGSSVGGMVGLAQYAILRYFIPQRSWFPWIYLSALGYGVGCVIVDGSWDVAFPVNGLGISWIGLMISILIGVILGALQFSFLDRVMPGRSWFPWVLVNMLAWGIGTQAYGFYSVLHYNLDEILYTDLLAEGIPVALVTGTGLVLILEMKQASGREA